MFLILLCAFHFSFCDWEFVKQWKTSIRVNSLKFSAKTSGYWDPLSNKADAFLKVSVYGELFLTDNTYTNYNPGTWYAVDGYGERVGSLGQVGSVTIEMRDQDLLSSDSMGGVTFSILNYRSLQTSYNFIVGWNGDREQVNVTVGLMPYTTLACSSRSASSSYPSCQSPADSYVRKSPPCGRLLNPAGSGTYLNTCVGSTDCGDNLTGNTVSNGHCMLLNCDNRYANSTHTYPCGENWCLQQLRNGMAVFGASSCLTSCSVPSHYEPNFNTGKCQWKACGQRTVNASMIYPCGTSDCFQQISNGGTRNASCATSCNADHFKEGTGGRCVLLDCAERTAVSSLWYPCGTADCYQQPNGSTCALACPEHFNETDDGRCSSLPCGVRIPFNGACSTSDGHPEDEPQCGFYTEVEENSTLSENSTPPFSGCVLCPDDHFVSVDGVCVLKTCSERVKNTTAKLLCGSANCFVQPKILTNNYDPNESDSGKCAMGCPEFYASTQGVCTILPCLERVPTNKTCRPDASFAENEPTCGYYSENNTAQGVCVHCPESHYRGANGVCVLKDCTARVFNATAEFPCGEPTCLLQLDPAGDGTYLASCDAECGSDLSVADNTTGRCELKDCVRRIANTTHNPFVCGDSLCFRQFDPTGDGTYLATCDAACGSDLSVADNTTGRCELKDCVGRMANTTHDPFACGDSLCFRQPSHNGTRSDCNRHCPMNVSTPDIFSGMCKYLECQQRFKDDVFGCGPDCYYFPDHVRMLSAQCVSECPPNFFLGEDGLQCEAKSCTTRDRSHECSLPSDNPETGRCFVHNDSVCVSVCPEGFSPEDTQHACVADAVKAKSSKTSFPWWVAAVIISVVVVSIVIVIVVLVIHKRTRKEVQKDEPSPQQQRALPNVGEAVVLMEEGNVKGSPCDDSVDFRGLHPHQIEMDVMPESGDGDRAVGNEEGGEKEQKE